MRRSITVVVLLLSASLLPATVRTISYLNDSLLLLIVATSSSSAVPRNPYSSDGILIGPEIALGLLRNLHSPYSRCVGLADTQQGCLDFLLIYAGRSIQDGGDPRANERAHALIGHFIDKGARVNAYSESGTTPVIEATLFGNAQYLALLLDGGGDPLLKAAAPSELAGKDAFQLVDELIQKDRATYAEVSCLLGNWRSGNEAALDGGCAD